MQTLHSTFTRKCPTQDRCSFLFETKQTRLKYQNHSSLNLTEVGKKTTHAQNEKGYFSQFPEIERFEIVDYRPKFFLTMATFVVETNKPATLHHLLNQISKFPKKQRS